MSLEMDMGFGAHIQQNFAVSLYEKFWGDCVVHENDMYAKDEDIAQLLDFGDVDKIIQVNENGQQIYLAQRFRRPRRVGGELVDADFTLRYSRPTSDHAIEYDRLMAAHGSDNGSIYPRRYSFGRTFEDWRTHGLKDLYIFDTDPVLTAIKNGDIREMGPFYTGEGQGLMAYKIEEIRSLGAIVDEWHYSIDDEIDIESILEEIDTGSIDDEIVVDERAPYCDHCHRWILEGHSHTDCPEGDGE